MGDMSITPLLIRPFIKTGESLSGFLYRAAFMNHYYIPSWLNNYLGISTYESQNNEFSESALSKLSQLTRLKVNQMQKHNGYQIQNSIGIDLYSKTIMKNNVKYCPSCLREDYYHRIQWSIVPVHMCDRHHLLLIELCPGCGNHISLRTLMNGKCGKCSFIFAGTEPIIAENRVFMEIQEKLIRCIWHKESCVLPNCNLDQFFFLAYHSFYLLGGACDYTGMLEHKLKLFYYRSDGKKSGLVFANAIANVYWMFSNFPNNFFNVLNDFLLRQRGQLRCDRLKSFEKIFDMQTFKWIQEAYSSFFIDQINSGTVRMSLDKFVSLKYDLISKKETGFILGIKSADVMRLVEVGYLTPVKVANFPNQVFSIQEVNGLLERCIGKIILEKHHSLISFQVALSRYSANFLTILDIIKYTLSGQLTPVCIGQNKKLADNYYEEKELEICLELINLNLQNEYRYVFSDVMKLLKIGEKRLWRTLEDNNIRADFTLIMKDGWRR